VKIILDTHIFLWALSEPYKLSEERKKMLETQANSIYVSSVSIAEIMIKSSIGKLNIEFEPYKAGIDSGFEFLDFSAEEALLLKDLPFHHKDPFDRMLIAQSLSRGHSIMSDDEAFHHYNCLMI